ncbi:uncharacterized protein B0T23DRAFT_86060 [Neurospora hispaniola]|uniref:Uncharacterized protein n=1 Tax=Neurospora hispaniola TaxID=588809 RepID=A0AAJ0MU07_9PEZI|nr:hypothetical protein B0T23DRAFT_86060 [Neurospora hispaniola]
MQENSCTKKLLMFCFWCANNGRRVTGVLVGTAPPMVLLLSFFSLCLFSFLLKRQWESTIPFIGRLFFRGRFFLFYFFLHCFLLQLLSTRINAQYHTKFTSHMIKDITFGILRFTVLERTWNSVCCMYVLFDI